MWQPTIDGGKHALLLVKLSQPPTSTLPEYFRKHQAHWLFSGQILKP